MGFKQRQKKRMKKAAMTKARKEARASHSAAMKWWLTLVGIDTCCARCAGMLRVGREMVYRRTPRESLCVSCAERDPSISARPSVRWERERASGRRSR